MYKATELAKGAANTFLGLKISYINAVADMCEAAGGDISQIVDILGIDPRIGAGGMRPGIGCLPKDVPAFTASARQCGAVDGGCLLSQDALPAAAVHQSVYEEVRFIAAEVRF
ncbi:hypothetical protein [Streptomyces sp. NPDC002209]|uniref:hypothetical protein n=1 Tax=Streptomyces sp. NPDC002209 TaxID=3364638 RepID=UPI0036C740EE